MFTSISSIQVNSEDGLPLQICELCKTEVFKCYLFKIKCKNSNNILKALIREQSTQGKDTNYTNETSKVIDEHNIKDPEGNTECTEENHIDNAKITQNKTEIDKDQCDVKVEIEYLEDIFEYSEDEVEKENVDKCLLGAQEDNESLQFPSTDFIEDTKPDPPSKRGKRKYYTCSFCSKRFLKAQTLQSHVTRSHGAQSAGAQSAEAQSRAAHPCAQCRESFGCAADLRIHSALHARGPPWACNQCHKNFDERGKLRRHVRRHMSGKRHACERCGKQFAERCALRRHARVHTGAPPDRPHACHLCDKRYSESSALAAHVLRHAGARPCACDACGKAFPSPRLLASHRRVHDDRKPHACRYCDKRFRHESTRNTHHRTHTGDKPYVCCACGKRFIQNSNLTLHMRTHTGEKPYSCESCERKFSSGSALASHRRTHTGEKPYSCPVCGKRFARVYLSAHMRQHSGERPFACCACGKRFASAARLRQHHLIHTGEKSFECAICSQKFKTKGYLAKHLKNHEMIKNLEKQKVLVMEQVDRFRSYFVVTNGKMVKVNDCAASALDMAEPAKENNITVEVKEKMPPDVAGEIILSNEGHVKTELVVINGEGHGNICLRASGVNYEGEVNYTNDVNLVTMDEGLVEIHTTGGPVTISKVTSKMTANF